MGIGDKAKHAAEKAMGKGKQTTGDATGDDRMKNEGKTDQSKADLKKAGDNVKDAFKK